MTKKLKFVKAQHPTDAATSAEHDSKPRRKGISKKALIGGALLAVGAGALAVLGRRNWPTIKKKAGELKDQADQATADFREQAGKKVADLKDQATKAAADLKDQAEHAYADLKDKATGKADADTADKGGKGATGDAKLNDEVAAATQSSPKAKSGFTDEGATGNND